MTNVRLGNMLKFCAFTLEPNMSFILQPWQFYFVILASMISLIIAKATTLTREAGRVL